MNTTKIIIFFSFLIFPPQIKAQNVQKDIEVNSFNQIESLLHNKKGKKIKIINFWATWCAPCIKELPDLQAIANKFLKNVELILVSLDSPKSVEKKVKPFLASRHIAAKVIVLDTKGDFSWVKKVNKEWSGSLPSTLIYDGYQEKFYEYSLSYERLEMEVKSFMSNPEYQKKTSHL